MKKSLLYALMILMSVPALNSCKDDDDDVSATSEREFMTMFRLNENTGKGEYPNDPYACHVEDLNTIKLYWYGVEGCAGYELKMSIPAYVASGEPVDWEDPQKILWDTIVGPDVLELSIKNLEYANDYRFAIRTLSKKGEAYHSHWYGYGAQEGGRDSHFASGKYAVYPGNKREIHKQSFVEGAFKLEGGTKMASAVMPIYSILWNQDPSGENVGGGFSKWMIEQQLRNDAKFEGVVCTDWGITQDMKVLDSPRGGKPWGVEPLTEAERHYKILQAGVDQFGGNNEIGPVLEAYQMWSKEFGEDSARQRFELSARRLLLNVFRVGLFENPYLDPAESKEIVGNAEFMKEGYEAQLKSVVMLKNHANQVLPVKDKKKVYVPKRHFPAIPGMWGGISEEKTEEPIDLTLVKKYFDVVEQPDQADFALCLIQEPSTGWGYSIDDVKKGGNGYVPVSLQYEDYTAVDARPVSIAGGDPMEKTTNRSFKGKTVKTYNRDDMVMVAETKKAMGDKPVVVVVEIGRPIVLSEIEPSADAILISFNVQHQTLLDIISGKSEPSALLPMQLPADMKAVEEQQEDVPRDMRCYQDADGNTYDFAFGLNWHGVIKDERVKKYK